MSEYTAIRAVSQSLKELLEATITAAGVEVVLKSPKEMNNDNQSGISAWLYRVTRNEHTLNRPPERISPMQTRRQPIPINLHYLLTPMMADPQDEQELLGRVLQVFHDHPVLSGGLLKGSLEASGEELRVFLETLTLEELTRVWGALQEPYQTSLSYLVQVVHIDSEEPPVSSTPVSQHDQTYSQILASN
jgi:hypothetical protein